MPTTVANVSKTVTLFRASWYFFSFHVPALLVIAYFGVLRKTPVWLERRPESALTELLTLIP